MDDGNPRWSREERDDYDAVLGAVPARATASTGSVSIAWAIVVALTAAALFGALLASPVPDKAPVELPQLPSAVPVAED